MTLTIHDRLLERAIRDITTGCLRWTGCHNSRGYGVVSVAGERKLAHRVSYELNVGLILDGLQIDHVLARGCIYKDCIEPTHLEPVTPRENVLRSPATHKSHCTHGHEMTPENTIIKRHKRGGVIRNCRECSNAQRRAARLVANARAGVLDSGVA